MSRIADLTLVFDHQVDLVGHDHDWRSLLRFLPEVLDPPLNILVATNIGAIIADDRALGRPIV